MSYKNEFATILSEADDYIDKGKDFPQIKLELYNLYFIAAIADELKDIRNELKKLK